MPIARTIGESIYFSPHALLKKDGNFAGSGCKTHSYKSFFYSFYRKEEAFSHIRICKEKVSLVCVRYSTLLHLPPSDSTVSEDAGIEPRTVATFALISVPIFGIKWMIPGWS
jgi:hypothetical protein